MQHITLIKITTSKTIRPTTVTFCSSLNQAFVFSKRGITLELFVLLLRAHSVNSSK